MIIMFLSSILLALCLVAGFGVYKQIYEPESLTVIKQYYESLSPQNKVFYGLISISVILFLVGLLIALIHDLTRSLAEKSDSIWSYNCTSGSRSSDLTDDELPTPHCDDDETAADLGKEEFERRVAERILFELNYFRANAHDPSLVPDRETPGNPDDMPYWCTK